MATTELTQRPATAGYEGWSATAVLTDLVTRVFPGRIALVSSFGAESAALLHMVASVGRGTPVIFIDTGKLFPETLAYRDRLCARLGLADVRTAGPSPGVLTQADPAGTLWQTEPDICCWHRKVEPLDAALDGFDAWISGRKRYQGGERGALPLVEQEPGGRTKVNPLAAWSAAAIASYCREHDLPPHPLEAQGYRSIGCTHCTRPVAAGEDPRAGRWANQTKTECGIHRPRQTLLPATRIRA